MARKPKIEILHQDAFEFLEGLKPNSVDLIISSPPYFMGKEYDTSMDVADFLEAHRRLGPLLQRAIKQTGSICWQVGHHVRNGITVPLDALVYSTFAECTDLQLRNRIVWTFGHGVHARKRLSGRHETILWYTKSDKYYFDLDAIRVPQKYPGKRHYKGPKKGEYSGNPLGKNPSDVWDIPNVKANHPEKSAHPCQFPVGLVQRLIRALTPATATIVDPFIGSGTTAIAAIVEQRDAIGCDINSKYVQLSNERVVKMHAGELKTRPLTMEIHVPKSGDSVSKMPNHFRCTAENLDG